LIRVSEAVAKVTGISLVEFIIPPCA